MFFMGSVIALRMSKPLDHNRDALSDADTHGRQPEATLAADQLMEQRGQDASAGAGSDFLAASAYRGVAFGDLDNDGRIDAVATVLNGKLKYFHNASIGENHWIALRLIGAKSNRRQLL